jgi:hypothetical protein
VEKSQVALLGKGIKTAVAVVIVAVLSIVVIASDLTTEGRAGFVIVYGIGAVVGLLVSLTAAILMRRRAPGLRAKTLLLTTGALVIGAALLSMESISETVVGVKTGDTWMIVFNYVFGYFMAGVSVDAARVLKARKPKPSE